MARFTVLGTAPIPGQNSQLRLLERNGEFTIKVAGKPGDLMNTRMHASEDALATLTCQKIVNRPAPSVLVGGLGMGFTLAAALATLGDNATVTVAELVPGVVEWNHGPLGEVAGFPVKDPRTRVHLGDVGQLLAQSNAAFDAILLDVDNGPEGFTSTENNWIYSPAGLSAAKTALRPQGILAFWSAGADDAFTKKLQKAGFTVKPVTVRAHSAGKGAKHVIWLAWCD